MEYGPPPLFRQGLPARLRFLFFVLVCVTLILVDTRFRALDNFRSAVADVTEPISVALHTPVAAFTSAKEYFSSKAKLHAENLRLSEENQHLSLAVAHLREMEEENERLRQLIDTVPRTQNKTLTAEVLGTVPDQFTRRVRINVGSDEGIQVGMPVLCADGVLGQISRVVRRSAEVNLLTDHRQQLSVFNERTGERFILAGTGEASLDLLFVKPGDDIKPGDRLLTTGLDHVFPRYIKAGVVQSVTLRPGETYRRVTVVAPDYSDIQFATIIQVDPNPTAELDRTPAEGEVAHMRRRPKR